MNLRCRLGFHKPTTIPREVRERAAKAGVTTIDWYAGREDDPYCVRCGCGLWRVRAGGGSR